MPQSSLGQWERGDTPQALHQLATLARHYEVSTDWLLGLTDDPAPADGRDMPDGADELLTIVRQLTVQERTLLLRQARALVQHHQAMQAWDTLRQMAIDEFGLDEWRAVESAVLDVLLRDGSAAALDEFQRRLAATEAATNKDVA